METNSVRLVYQLEKLRRKSGFFQQFETTHSISGPVNYLACLRVRLTSSYPCPRLRDIKIVQRDPSRLMYSHELLKTESYKDDYLTK